ncbi:hypothetical protein [Paenibacillus amylolyticus]|uniref:hypothetical protein n=1 Tax=Paenibacillus amylolyticus TaxID=1451 RepID=UPI003D967856
MYSRLLDLLEEERRKLNQLGESLKQAIPLWDNPEVQEQSRGWMNWWPEWLK